MTSKLKYMTSKNHLIFEHEITYKDQKNHE